MRGLKSLTVSCPACGNSQEESVLAVSSNCRLCGAYFKIADGKAVSNDPGSAAHPGVAVAASSTDRRDEDRRASSKNAPLVRNPDEQTPTRNEVLSQMAHAGSGEQRDIECLECGHVHRIAHDAANALCPRCGDCVSLSNFEIDASWDRQIRTRGNVFVMRSGHIANVSVHCSPLTAEGNIDGSVLCSSSLIVLRDCTFRGPVTCHRLLVENGAKVVFEKPVRADEVFVDGTVNGDIHCRGTLVLEPKAMWNGDIEVKAIDIGDGARHCGRISVGNSAQLKA